MRNFSALLIGELQRMGRYNIVTATLIVNFIWIAVLHFSQVEDVTALFPMLVMLDATSMAILLIGVTLFFEKQEGTLRTLLVSPISRPQYVLAKTCGNVIINLLAIFILYGYAYFFKEINLSLWGLVGAVILVCFFHSFVGFLLSYYSKDFTELIMGMMKYFFIFMIPVALEMVGIITNEAIKNALYLIPTKASMVLLQGSLGQGTTFQIGFSSIYLVGITAALYWLVLKKFNQFAFKESGV